MTTESIAHQQRAGVLSTLCMFAVLSSVSCTPAQLGSAYLAGKVDAPPARYNVVVPWTTAV